jgi:hypothetical protein
MRAEQADGDRTASPPVTRCCQRVSVHIECMIDGLGAARKHQRVLRASPSAASISRHPKRLPHGDLRRQRDSPSAPALRGAASLPTLPRQFREDT